jgi:DNA polymerase-3 subunit delta
VIIKLFDKKLITSDINFFLFYGVNEGQKEEVIEKIIKNNTSKNLYNYEESEILVNPENFKESVYNHSFFENGKLIIVNRVTDKLLNVICEIIEKKIDDVKIILKSGLLERQSKLRKFFEKNNELIITPFYSDNLSSLVNLAKDFVLKNKLKISSKNINFIIEKTNGNRIALKTELEKILLYYKRNFSINFSEINKLVNNTESIEISELTDQYLLKNKKKIFQIINENIFYNEENISIIKNFIFKLKRLKKLKIEIDRGKSIDQVLSNHRPIIFWKDKDILKQQLQIWSIKDLKSKLIEVNNLELFIKNNLQISNQILNNFILERFEYINN